nr:LysR family transcriptional regulator substrate-binding protein [Moritella sp. 24]
MTHESDTLHHQLFEYCRLGHYRDVLVSSPQHPLASLPIVTTNELSQYRELILGEASEHSEGFSPSYATFSDIQPLIAMLKHHKGFAFLPAEYVNTAIERNQLVKLNCDFEPAGINRRVELCWRNGLTLSKQGCQVISAFKENHQLIR